MTRTILLYALLAAAPAAASSPDAWADLDRREVAACTAAAKEVSNPQVGAAIRFSDTIGVDVREVTGRYKPRHMKGAKARMFCAYDRRKATAEIQEKPAG